MQEDSTARRNFHDPVHDYIPLSSEVCKVVDTVHFQRLRSIKQNGVLYFVWLGACHNRFEHSLGVAHLARRTVEHLQKLQPELGITDRDVCCIELAGLCHDLGHGPWSHLWDGTFIPLAIKDKRWAHEDASEMMFDDMRRQYKDTLDISDDDAEYIKALIRGEPKRYKNAEGKEYLFEIVANKRNGIDVDKFDYIMRDTRAVGERGNLTMLRLLTSARVIDNQICYDVKDANQLYELCYMRFSLHKRIYNHKTSNAIEYMIIDALLKAEKHLKIAERIEDPQKYLYLTDNIMEFIEQSSDPELAESRRIFKRVRERDLYKCVDYKVFDWDLHATLKDNISPAKIVAEIKKMPMESLTSTLPEGGVELRLDAREIDELPSSTGSAAFSTAKDGDAMAEEELVEDALRKVVDEIRPENIHVTLSKLHYGMGDKNPLDFIRFYTKQRPNKCLPLNEGVASGLTPAKFGEVLVRIYTTDIHYFGITQAGFRSLAHKVLDADTAPVGTTTTPATITVPALAASSVQLPVTPPTHPRPLPGPGSSGTMSGGNSPSHFQPNNFTTVPPSWGATMSPSRVSGKRTREKDVETLPMLGGLAGERQAKKGKTESQVDNS